MKTKILFFLTILSLLGCSKDDNIKTDPVFQLPPETQIGANTFGVTIRGKVYIPRDPIGTGTGITGKGMSYYGSNISPWREIKVKDGASAVGFNLIIHFKNLPINALGIYQLKNSNFQDDIDSINENHIFFKIWDAAINNYAYYGSIENQGEIIVTKFFGSPTVQYILSGTFNGKFVRYDNPTDFIQITDGRFDLNLNTLSNHPFP